MLGESLPSSQLNTEPFVLFEYGAGPPPETPDVVHAVLAPTEPYVLEEPDNGVP